MCASSEDQTLKPKARLVVRNPGSIGTAIREFRALRGWTQEQLADELGVSRRYVWRMERAEPTQQIDRVVQALTALGATITIEETEAARRRRSREARR